MMSFFKKENKEDKERKKIERKLIKDTTTTTSSTNYNNNNGSSLASSSMLLSSSSTSSLSNLSNTKLLKSSSNNEELMSSSSSSYNLHDESNMNQSQCTNTNAPDAFLTLPPPLPSIGPPPVAPKPKKGILKTMSKFGIGGGNTNSTLPTQVFSSATSSPSVKQIETSIANYSKRNSQFVSELPNFNTNTATTITTPTSPNIKVC